MTTTSNVDNTGIVASRYAVQMAVAIGIGNSDGSGGDALEMTALDSAISLVVAARATYTRAS